MTKLIVAWIVEGDEDVWKLSYDSVKDIADHIIIIDGNKDNSSPISRYDFYKHKNHHTWNRIPYLHDDKGANGKQRNEYLNELKEDFIGDWCLVLDADEFVDNPKEILSTIKIMEEQGVTVCSPGMRHFIGDLAHEDSTQKDHFVPLRLFKVTPELYYDEVEHPVLRGWTGNLLQGSSFTVWHLAYSREVFRTWKKYKNHCEKSNIHSKDYLDNWYCSHLFGQYPRAPLNLQTLPPILLEHLEVPDSFYFQNRGLETKHAVMVKQWDAHFAPQTVLDLGCGRGPYLFFWEGYINENCKGVELSQWAVEHSFVPNNVVQGDITTYPVKAGVWSLITCIDVLEHLDDNQLDAALNNIAGKAKSYLFSIPFIGDPNLANDSTHKQFMTKEQWIAKIECHGIKIVSTPENFLFKEQLLVGVNNGRNS